MESPYGECRGVFPDTDGHGHLRLRTQVDQWQASWGPGKVYNWEQGCLRGTGLGWGQLGCASMTLSTTKIRAESLIGDNPDTLYSKLWAARPRPFDHRGEGWDVYTDGQSGLNAVS